MDEWMNYEQLEKSDKLLQLESEAKNYKIAIKKKRGMEKSPSPS